MSPRDFQAPGRARERVTRIIGWIYLTLGAAFLSGILRVMLFPARDDDVASRSGEWLPIALPFLAHPRAARIDSDAIAFLRQNLGYQRIAGAGEPRADLAHMAFADGTQVGAWALEERVVGRGPVGEELVDAREHALAKSYENTRDGAAGDCGVVKRAA